jgi:hypothetical protein
MGRSTSDLPIFLATAGKILMIKLSLEIGGALLPRFFYLLQQGFVVTAETGCSIKDLLCQQMGIDKNYLRDRIQTLFLNGMPVDDFEKAFIQGDATLALSGAMPGLVGAVLRSGGILAAMRNTISYSGGQTPGQKHQARVTIKLFNLILKELGPLFLANGVLIPSEKFQDFILRNLADLKTASSSVRLNKQQIKVADLKNLDWKDPEIFLQATARAES